MAEQAESSGGGLFTKKRLALGCGGLIALFLVCAIFGALVGNDTGETGELAEGAIATATTEPDAVVEEAEAAPEPTEQEAPADTPEPTSTPAPTDTPAPTATPTTPPTATPPPEPVVFSGAGTNITDDFTLTGSVLIVDMQHTGGSSNFAVWLKDAVSGGDVELFANEIGQYTGRKAAQVGSGDYFFQIEADGQWNLTAMTPAHLERDDSGPPYEFSGTGDTVTPLFMLNGGRLNIEMAHTGSSNFALIIFNASAGEYGALLANEIGPYEGITTASAGEGWHVIDVTADGNWRISLAQ